MIGLGPLITQQERKEELMERVQELREKKEQRDSKRNRFRKWKQQNDKKKSKASIYIINAYIYILLCHINKTNALFKYIKTESWN